MDYSGRDNRRLKEVSEIYRIIQNLKEISGSTYAAEVGILQDYDNIWDAQLDKWHSDINSHSQKALFNACQKTHTPFYY